MSILSDVQALYDSVETTWAKHQAHVIAHVILAVVLFGICRASIPPGVSISWLDPKQISDSAWFKLAKDIGIVYVSFLVPILVLAAYLALLRFGGQLLVATVMLIWRPSLRHQYRLLSPRTLEPLALAVGKSDFDLTDLHRKAADFALRYEAKKNGNWEKYQESLSKLTKNAQLYLGDFLLLLVFWILLFKLMPQASWVQANGSRFWPVALTLSVLALLARFRVSRVMGVLPSLSLIYVSTMIQSDPEMKAILEVSEETKGKVSKRIEELLSNEQERADSRPSLMGFLRFRMGQRRSATKHKDAKLVRGWPFPSIYEDGYRFSWDSERHNHYDTEWVAGYFAYLYYRVHTRVFDLARAVWLLVRYIVTGWLE